MIELIELVETKKMSFHLFERQRETSSAGLLYRCPHLLGLGVLRPGARNSHMGPIHFSQPLLPAPRGLTGRNLEFKALNIEQRQPKHLT